MDRDRSPMTHPLAKMPRLRFLRPVAWRRLCVMVPLLLLVLIVGCSSGGSDLQRLADAFDAPSEWDALGGVEVSDSLCIRAGCEIVMTAWSAATAPTADDFNALMRQAGWTDVEINDCQVRPDVTGPIPFCRATVWSGGIDIELPAA